MPYIIRHSYNLSRGEWLEGQFQFPAIIPSAAASILHKPRKVVGGITQFFLFPVLFLLLLLLLYMCPLLSPTLLAVIYLASCPNLSVDIAWTCNFAVTIATTLVFILAFSSWKQVVPRAFCLDSFAKLSLCGMTMLFPIKSRLENRLAQITKRGITN